MTPDMLLWEDAPGMSYHPPEFSKYRSRAGDGCFMHVLNSPKWPRSPPFAPGRGIPTWGANACDVPTAQALRLPQQTWQMLWASFDVYFFAILNTLSWKGRGWRLYIKAAVVFIELSSICFKQRCPERFC